MNFDSESIAYVGLNPDKGETYIRKDNWDKFKFDNLDNDLNYDFNNDISNDINSDLINENKKRIIKINNFKGSSRATVCLPSSRYFGFFYDFYLIVHLTDYENDFNVLEEINYIDLEIGGSRMNRIFMFENLFFAKLLGKKIKYEDNLIKIPIVILELFNTKKFPGYRLIYHEFRLFFDFKKVINNNIELEYLVEKAPDEEIRNNIGLELKTFQSLYSGADYLKPEISLNLRLLINFITFEFVNSKEEILLEMPNVNEVRLYLCNQSPIIFRDILGEIFRFDYKGRSLFGISLSPEFKSFKDLKKILVSDNNNSHNKKNIGINFSRIDNAKISFDIDQPNDNMMVCIKGITLNFTRFIGGMAGLAYSN